MKIAYIIESMYNSGGMERVLTVCANEMSKRLDVTIVTLQQKGRDYYFPLNPFVHCCDLGIESFNDGQNVKNSLSHYLNKQNFDVVISLGGVDMFYLHTIRDGSKKIVWFHFAFNVCIGAWIGNSPSLLKKVKGYLQLIRRIYHARKYDEVVAISKSDCSNWGKCVKNVIQISNPVTINNNALADLSAKKVISVGRLDIQKGYHYLIESWNIVAKKKPDWHLDIYGEGYLRNELHEFIDSLNLNNQVTLCGSSSDIVSKYLEHSIYVSSSITEAFSLVLIEASACGLPLIAFDCPTGPRDIVEDGVNGFLVQDVGDVNTMSDRILQLIDNIELRHQMGDKAKVMAKRYEPNRITEQWYDMIVKLLEK